MSAADLWKDVSRPPVSHVRTQVAVQAFTASTAPLVLGHRQAGQLLQLDTSLQQVTDDFHVLDVMPFEAALHLGILIFPPILHLQYAGIQRCVSPAQYNMSLLLYILRTIPHSDMSLLLYVLLNQNLLLAQETTKVDSTAVAWYSRAGHTAGFTPIMALVHLVHWHCSKLWCQLKTISAERICGRVCMSNTWLMKARCVNSCHNPAQKEA